MPKSTPESITTTPGKRFKMPTPIMMAGAFAFALLNSCSGKTGEPLAEPAAIERAGLDALGGNFTHTSPVETVVRPVQEGVQVAEAQNAGIRTETVEQLHRGRDQYLQDMPEILETANLALDQLEALRCGESPTDEQLREAQESLLLIGADVEALEFAYASAWGDCVTEFGKLGTEFKNSLQEQWDLVSRAVGEDLSLLAQVKQLVVEAPTEMEIALRTRLAVNKNTQEVQIRTLAQIENAELVAQAEAEFGLLRPVENGTFPINTTDKAIDTYIEGMCTGLAENEKGVFFYYRDGWEFIDAQDQCGGPIDNSEYDQMVERIFSGEIRMSNGKIYSFDATVPGIADNIEFKLRLSLDGRQRLVAAYDANLSEDDPGLKVVIVNGKPTFSVVGLDGLYDGVDAFDEAPIVLANGVALDQRVITPFFETN